MTTRQRQAIGSAAASAANGVSARPDGAAPFSWDDWFHHASIHQRAAALDQAQQHGIICSHQLPAITNGVKSAAVVVKDTQTSQLIARLLAGKADALPPLSVADAAVFDADLDEVQRLAVARALATPDLLLLQGLPGTGKSRVLAEIILQAASRGWRVLLLAGHTASLDAVLQRLVGRSEIFAIRYLDALEKPESLPAWVRSFTLDEQRHAFLQRLQAGAGADVAAAESVCRQRRDQEAHWIELQNCADRHREVQDRLHAIQAEVAGLTEAVARDADAPGLDTDFASTVAELRRAHDEELRQVDAAQSTEQQALTQCEQEITQLAATIADREPAYLAKKQSRWWTLMFWRHLLNSQIVQATEAVMAQHASALSVRAAIAQRRDQLAERRGASVRRYQQELAVHIGNEIQTRQLALQSHLKVFEEIDRQQNELWCALCRQLEITPAEKTHQWLAAEQDAWGNQKKKDEQRWQFAQRWQKYLAETGPMLAAKLPTIANLLTGTVMRWHTDARLREAVVEPVDLLIIEDAESLTEADVLKLSRHAQRCILVGQTLAEPAPTPTAAEKASRALLPAPLVSAACWNKLWQSLGGDAGRWPHTWRRDHGKLVCQLIPLSVDDRQHLESEGLTDAPDIELAILHRPRTQPCLAQVIFATHCTFAEAFRFMIREVQEFPLEALGHTGWWSENAQRHCRHLGPGAASVQNWLEIEPGVRLGIGAVETRVVCIEFGKATGWDRAAAESWVQRRRPVHDTERATFLQVPYRFHPELGRVVQELMCPADWMPTSATCSNSGLVGFEFVPVPAPAKVDWPREGAGLEVDLSGARFADRLPVGLRQGLPGRGFVNYLEAQALVRRLEGWQPHKPDWNGSVAVAALYEGQVELLRRLIQQSEVLRARGLALEVALPSRLHQREFDFVFLSLTRSHAHRPVAFSEDVKELPLAFTRPRRGIYVFGDPGALVKRITWHGPLDHRDAHSAQQELVGLTRLFTYLQAQAKVLAHTNGIPVSK